MNVKEAWQKIEVSGGAGLVLRRLSPETRDPLYAAVDTVRNIHLLVLECLKIPAEGILQALRSTDGYLAKCASLDIGSAPKVCLFLESTPETPKEVFESLCEDVSQCVLSRKASESAEDIFAGRLLLWKRLFDSRRAAGLTEEERLGLLAEIIHLRDILGRWKDAAGVMISWTGPDRLANDFQSSSGRTEVKATTTRRQYKIRINGERQLETIDERPLCLVAMMFERVVSDGFSLPTVIRQLREHLGAGSSGAELFNAKLLEGGYLDIHEQAYAGDCFRLNEQREYRVLDGFPRIISENVPEGVGDLQYSIDLSSCEKFRVAEGTAAKILSGEEYFA